MGKITEMRKSLKNFLGGSTAQLMTAVIGGPILGTYLMFGFVDDFLLTKMSGTVFSEKYVHDDEYPSRSYYSFLLDTKDGRKSIRVWERGDLFEKRGISIESIDSLIEPGTAVEAKGVKGFGDEHYTVYSNKIKVLDETD